uniref:Transmembrane protein C18orf45-like protein n=1 Tax=Magallana gigas TaxID=29159 RepID=K1QAR8_MAGGI
MLFAGSVYSGSKGLANLPVPVFFALQNLSSVIVCGVQMIITQTLTSFFTYCMMMLTVISSVVIIHSDPQGGYKFIQSCQQGDCKLGDALEAASFPYLYFSKFWFGCILSGVFGVLLSLHSINLQEKESGPVNFAKVQGCSKDFNKFVGWTQCRRFSAVYN